jgi:hypothetical protein
MTVLWYCPGLTPPLTRNCEWTRLVSEARSSSPVFSPPFLETEREEMSAIAFVGGEADTSTIAHVIRYAPS